MVDLDVEKISKLKAQSDVRKKEYQDVLLQEIESGLKKIGAFLTEYKDTTGEFYAQESSIKRKMIQGTRPSACRLRWGTATKNAPVVYLEGGQYDNEYAILVIQEDNLLRCDNKTPFPIGLAGSLKCNIALDENTRLSELECTDSLINGFSDDYKDRIRSMKSEYKREIEQVRKHIKSRSF